MDKAKTIKLNIDEENDNERLDITISGSVENFSRSQAQKLIESGGVKINGDTIEKPSKTVKNGDVIEIDCPELKPVEILPQNIPLDIVFQNSMLAVINKQRGLTVHPANGIYTDTLVNALLFHLSDLSGINGELRPGIVHRLDKETSGLMLVAKNDVAHRSLAEQIQTKECKRTYYALVEGVIKEDSGIIDKPIARSTVDRKKMAVDSHGKTAVTEYTVLTRYAKNTLVKFQLQTGRTHQIRVHAKYIGHPVVGDKTYGYKNQRFNLEGQLLHSKEIQFTDPESGKVLQFQSDLPDYFLRILKIIENERI
ncbi:MAG TPA: RluA family pseudouridine synthase [Clostridia bacterium]|nr:RluA family pseudouridine synthase [Clostridia bacterium]